MNNRVNQTYKREGSRVYGNGTSYNLTNNITATELCQTLNHLTEIQNTNSNIDNKLDKITRQIIQMKLSINTLDEEVKTLTELIKNDK
ncbi:MAG: hypothetical protein J6Y78_07275 [Paludibacteraceae bacterium]|nr:hypothetical protein [Paludibacteraceae bacterium]